MRASRAGVIRELKPSLLVPAHAPQRSRAKENNESEVGRFCRLAIARAKRMSLFWSEAVCGSQGTRGADPVRTSVAMGSELADGSPHYGIWTEIVHDLETKSGQCLEGAKPEFGVG